MAQAYSNQAFSQWSPYRQQPRQRQTPVDQNQDMNLLISGVLQNQQPEPVLPSPTGYSTSPTTGQPTSTPNPSQPAAQPQSSWTPQQLSQQGFDVGKLESGHVSPKYVFAKYAQQFDTRTPEGREQLLNALRADPSGYFKEASWGGSKGDILQVGGQLHPDFNGISQFDVFRGAGAGEWAPVWQPIGQDQGQGGAGQAPMQTAGSPGGGSYGGGGGSSSGGTSFALGDEIAKVLREQLGSNLLTPEAIAQMKERNKESALAMQRQAGDQLGQNAIQRGMASPTAAAQGDLLANTIQSILSGNREVDLGATQMNREAMNQAIQNALGLNSQNIQSNLGWGDLDLRRGLGYAGLDLDRQRLAEQMRQFNSQMGFNYNQLGAGLTSDMIARFLQGLG